MIETSTQPYHVKKSSRSRIAALWLSVLLVMTAIFLMSSVPGGKKPGDPFSNADKGEHFIVYGILAFTLYGAVGSTAGARTRLFHAVAALVIAALYAVSDEVHQGLVPGRSRSPADLVADIIGASVVVLVMHVTNLMGGRKL
ncbi:MAG: VanZ family protein [Armatimonadota bacterium]|nr:VanZ family protein [Armatimonadota bacterium]